MLKTGKYNGWIIGNEMARSDNSSMEIAHLQYADDTLIFYDANVEQLMHLRENSVLIECVLGLHIKWRKFSLFPINEVTDMEFLASMLGRRSWVYLLVCLQGQNPRKFRMVLLRSVRRNWVEVPRFVAGRKSHTYQLRVRCHPHLMSLSPISVNRY